MKVSLSIILFLLLPGILFSQQYSTQSRKAVKRFEEAVVLYRDMDNDGAELLLKQAIKSDEGFLEAYHLLSQIYLETGRLEEAIQWYSVSVEIDPEGNPEAHRLLAGMLLRKGDYQAAKESVEKYLAYPPETIAKPLVANTLLRKCDFALYALDHPVPFEPENLGDSVNSELSEYWPALSVDEELLMFTVMIPHEAPQPRGVPSVQEDFFTSRRMEGEWGSRQNAGPPLNTSDNEGAHSMIADGQVLFFTACNRRDGKGQCDIYTSRRVDGAWSKPLNLGAPVNSRYSEKHPSVSADGRRLFFTSDRPGGKGSFDIWMSEFRDGKWGAPQNLGDSVNSAGVEQSPFLHPDQQSLYFSSDGWIGMGQGDLFMTRQTGPEVWSTPENMGYPINTHNDEIGLTVNARGTRAYFASNRESGTDTDLYSFDLPEAFRPVPVSYVSGRVYDSRNMKGLEAVIQLIDLETEEIVMESLSGTAEGSYLLSLPTNRDYALNVSAEGYLFYSGHFAFRGEHSLIKPFRRDIPMDRILVGSRVVLNNIFFDTDSYQLKPASRAELEKLYAFLEQNPSLKVELSGHTDDRGSADHNHELSLQRALAVKSYLAERGIEEVRLSARGFGAEDPVADNETEEGRALNRRTELTITGTKE